jgi:hypothetical protein
VNKNGRILLWVAGGFGIIALGLLLALQILAPRVTNLESTKVRIQAEFSKTVGGELDFQRVDLSLFPRPGVIVRGAILRVPQTGQGTIESVKVCPAILPLFTGKLRIAKLRLEEPAFELQSPEMPELGKKGIEHDPSDSLKRRTAHLLDVLALKAPNLEVVVRKGRLELLDDDRSFLTLHNLDADVVLPPRGPGLRITCGSNLWRDLSVEGSLDATSLKGKGRIELARFQPQFLTNYLFPDAGIRCSESIVYLRIDARTDGLREFHGELKASAPSLILQRGKEESLLKVENLGITFSIEEDKTALSLDQLSLESPRLRMSGKFSTDEAASDVRLALEARDMDVDSARKAALDLGGNLRLVRDIFDFVRGGEIPVIRFQSQGQSFDQLGKDEAFRIEGRLRDGKIHIRGPDLDLQEVKGDAVISNGILEGKNLEARLGNSRGSQGELRVGLKGKDAPFHLDIAVDADIAEVHPILMRVVKAEAFVREMSLVENINGRGLGRMVLGESLQSVEAKVDVSECSISAEYRRIPYSIRIEAGQVAYGTGWIGGTNMSGTLGNSSFSGLTYRVDFGDAPHLEIDSGQFGLFMDEIYPWLISYESIRRDLGLFRDVTGKIEIAGMRLKGPVLQPVDWDFEAEGTVENLILDTHLCPKPVAIASGKLGATPEELSFTKAGARILDASLDASGVLQGYLRGLGQADIDLAGTIGPEAMQWISGIINLPPALKVRTPFSLTSAKLVWNKDRDTAFKGDFTFPQGAKGSLDLLQSPEKFILNRLAFQDQASRATLSVTRTTDALGLNFTGDLTNTTLDKIFVEDFAKDLHLKGDLLLNVRLDKPVFSKAQGHLEARGFNIPYSWMAPIRIEGLSLDASEKGLKVDPAHFILEDSHVSLQGDLSFVPEYIRVDMDLASDGINWEAIERVIDRAKEEKAVARKGPSYWPPLEGTVRCRTESFTYGQFTWRPLHASVTFSPNDVRIAVTEADLCGISTLGVFNVDEDEVTLDFRLISKDQDLEPTFPCLSDTERQVTGLFDLTGEVTGQGRGDRLIQSMQGDLEISARNGNILRDPLLAKVFSVLNVTEILRGRMPDLRSDDLAYDSLTIKSDLQNGSLTLKEVTLNGPTVGIAGEGSLDLIGRKVDLQLIVAPLKTVDFIVERTPVVSSITGGNLITVPVRVRGDWRNPNATLLSASAVGSRLLAIMKNTLMLPVEIVEPVIPKQSEKKASP